MLICVWTHIDVHAPMCIEENKEIELCKSLRNSQITYSEHLKWTEFLEKFLKLNWCWILIDTLPCTNLYNVVIIPRCTGAYVLGTACTNTPSTLPYIGCLFSNKWCVCVCLLLRQRFHSANCCGPYSLLHRNVLSVAISNLYILVLCNPSLHSSLTEFQVQSLCYYSYIFLLFKYLSSCRYTVYILKYAIRNWIECKCITLYIFIFHWVL